MRAAPSNKEIPTNRVVHFEVPSKDGARVSSFYSNVFGWNMQQMGAEMGDYILATTTETDEQGMIKQPGAINGGFFKHSDVPNAAPSVVIEVEDIRAHMKRVTDAGGEVIGEPQEIPGVGQFVAFVDTEGNRLSMIQPPAHA